MRIAVISDVHGNAAGLDAALADAGDVDAYVFLGDVLQGGPQPREVFDILRSLPNARFVLGNADAFLVDPDAGLEVPNASQLEVREWTNAQLGADGLAFIEAMQPTVRTGELLAFHGSPSSYDDVIQPTVTTAELDAFLGADRAPFMCGGHIHQQWQRRVGATTFFNPGSAGLSYDPEQPEDDFRFDPWAAYALVDGTELAFRRVPFDHVRVIEAYRGLPQEKGTAWRWQPR